MSPAHKESAMLHLPTYIAGMAFHAGIFYGFFWLVLLFFGLQTGEPFRIVSFYLLLISAACGTGLLIKRVSLTKMRNLSNADDYFSNLLVTGFLVLVALTLVMNSTNNLFIYSAILLLYIPLGKLRHSIYFATTRIHLGVFYGRRGVWPIQKIK